MRPPFDLDAMVAGIRAAERATLGRSITLVESKHPDDRAHAHQLLARLAPDTGRAHRIGITGVPGVGKSTFIDAFGLALCDLAAPGPTDPADPPARLSIGVLAVDPTSEKTGGSILGDKTRMPRLATDSRAFIRPSPAGGTLGGVAARTREATLVLEAAGCSHVLIETVGVGQSETAVAHLVDTFVLLALPGAGDELQGIKRGIMEMADLVVVTKADGELERPAHRAAAHLRAALRLLHPAGEPPEVLVTSALEGLGIAEVLAAADAHVARQALNGKLAAQRAGQNLRWLWALVDERVRDRIRHELAGELASIEAAVESGALPVLAAVDRLLTCWPPAH